MKKALRIIPLILALAILAACGMEPAAETPDVTGAETQPTASPEPSPEAGAAGLPQYFTQPRAVPDGLDFPDYGFAVEEYYLAEPFSLSGRALLLRGTDEGGGERFACRYMSYAPDGGDYVLLGESVEGGAEELASANRAARWCSPCRGSPRECPRRRCFIPSGGRRPCARTATCPTWTR